MKFAGDTFADGSILGVLIFVDTENVGSFSWLLMNNVSFGKYEVENIYRGGGIKIEMTCIREDKSCKDCYKQCEN